jgi:hypothetical protein
MTAHVYKLPSTSDERKRLVSEIREMAEKMLGYPARQANIENWTGLPMVQLRLCHAKWTETAKPKEAVKVTGRKLF